MLRFKLYIVLFVFAPLMGFAQDLQVDSLRSWYDQGKYDDVIVLISAMEEQGYNDADLHYNKGNAHFKSGDKAKAVQYYLKALKLNPNHRDAKFNLAIVEQGLLDKFEAVSTVSFSNFLKRINTVLPNRLLSLLSFVCLLVALVLAFRVKTGVLSVNRRLLWSLFIFSVVVGSWSLIQKSAVAISDKVVVAFNGVQVKSSPTLDGVLLFELNEGSSLLLLEKQELWYKVQTKDGNQGWVRVEEVLDV